MINLINKCHYQSLGHKKKQILPTIYLSTDHAAAHAVINDVAIWTGDATMPLTSYVGGTVKQSNSCSCDSLSSYMCKI